MLKLVWSIAMLPWLYGSATAEEPSWARIESSSALGVKIIQAAKPELLRYNAQIKDYDIEIFRVNNRYEVLFRDLSSHEECHGSCGRKPNIEVAVHSGNFTIIRSNLSR